MKMIDDWLKNDKVWFINLFGLFLLIIKLTGIPIYFGYFAIVSIIFWQIIFYITWILCVIFIMASGGMDIWLAEKNKPLKKFLRKIIGRKLNF